MEEIFKNPKTISGLTELYKRAKHQDKNFALKDAKEFFKNKYTSQIHKPLPSRHMHFLITANKENDVIQIDLMDVSNISTKNKNYKYVFVCVDVYSRKGCTIPIKNKNTLNVIEAFKKFLLLCKPKKIMCDNGSEFISKNFVEICKEKILTLIILVLVII